MSQFVDLKKTSWFMFSKRPVLKVVRNGFMFQCIFHEKNGAAGRHMTTFWQYIHLAGPASQPFNSDVPGTWRLVRTLLNIQLFSKFLAGA